MIINLCNSTIFSGAFCQITVSNKYSTRLKVNMLLHYPSVISQFLDDNSSIEDSMTEKEDISRHSLTVTIHLPLLIM